MKTYEQKIWLHVIIVLALIMLIVAGCGGNGGNDTEDTTEQPELPAEETNDGAEVPGQETDEPPELPPAGSFIIDFSEFTSPDEISSVIGDEEAGWRLVSYTQPGSDLPVNPYAEGEQKNWNFAALNVGFWNIVLVVGLVVPVAAFLESFNHVPEQQPDYSWLWYYEVPANNDMYTAELYGKFISSGVRWDMYISKAEEFSDFHWYYGESNLPATEGFWILKNSPTNPTDLLRIDWQRDISDGSSEIQYTNIVPGGSENGGYILYGVTTGGPYDRYYDIYNKGKNNHTYIEWNSVTQEGRGLDINHFGDNDWHCWDGGHYDSACP